MSVVPARVAFGCGKRGPKRGRSAGSKSRDSWTIKPGSYPDTRNPAHIHYVVNAAGYKERVFEIVFADDPLVNERIRADAAREGSGFSIRALARNAQGMLRCTQDIRLAK